MTSALDQKSNFTYSSDSLDSATCNTDVKHAPVNRPYADDIDIDNDNINNNASSKDNIEGANSQTQSNSEGENDIESDAKKPPLVISGTVCKKKNRK